MVRKKKCQCFLKSKGHKQITSFYLKCILIQITKGLHSFHPPHPISSLQPGLLIISIFEIGFVQVKRRINYARSSQFPRTVKSLPFVV